MKYLLIVLISTIFSITPVFAVDNPVITLGNLAGKVITNGGINPVDTVVFIDYDFKKTFPLPETPQMMNQLQMEFTPFILPILLGTTVRFLNSDTIFHNVYSPSEAAFDLVNKGSMNLGIFMFGEHVESTFTKPGIVLLFCNIHKDMEAYILVVKNPYFTRPDKDGKYEIKNIPTGVYPVRVWSKKKQTEIQQIKIIRNKISRADFILK